MKWEPWEKISPGVIQCESLCGEATATANFYPGGMSVLTTPICENIRVPVIPLPLIVKMTNEALAVDVMEGEARVSKRKKQCPVSTR